MKRMTMCGMYITLGSVRFVLCNEVSSAHQGCIYLIKNTVKIVKYDLNFK